MYPLVQDDPLGAYLVPLWGDGVVLDLQAIYDSAYQDGTLAAQLYLGSELPALPAPTSLSLQTRHALEQTLQAWRDMLNRLRENK